MAADSWSRPGKLEYARPPTGLSFTGWVFGSRLLLNERNQRSEAGKRDGDGAVRRNRGERQETMERVIKAARSSGSLNLSNRSLK